MIYIFHGTWIITWLRLVDSWTIYYFYVFSQKNHNSPEHQCHTWLKIQISVFTLDSSRLPWFNAHWQSRKTTRDERLHARTPSTRLSVLQKFCVTENLHAMLKVWAKKNYFLSKELFFSPETRTMREELTLLWESEEKFFSRYFFKHHHPLAETWKYSHNYQSIILLIKFLICE